MPNTEHLRNAIEDVVRNWQWREPVWTWTVPLSWCVLTSMAADPDQVTILMYDPRGNEAVEI